jgi:serine/threonine-protein kinase
VTEEAQGSLPAGKIIAGRFRIDRLIGRGGMGEVYAAKNVGTGRDVALKMIRGAADAEQKRRFLREAKAATAIDHPSVIEVLDVFQDDEGTPVMVMELLRGETLASLRKRRGALPLHEVASLLLPVASALRAAHRKGIVHRDMKPDNVFLCETSTGAVVPKVLDFGIAKVRDPASISSETQGGSTSTGSILGTPHYMAFEQAMSEKDIDHRADIWAVGVIVFEALTGRRPLEFENLGQMYTAFLQGEVPKIRAVVPDLPQDVADIVDRCLEKHRESRLDDLGPLIDVLGRYVDSATPGARAGGTVIDALPTGPGATLSGAVAAQTAARGRDAPPAAGRRPPWALVGAGVAIVAVGVGAAVVFGRGRAPSGDPSLSAPSGVPEAHSASTSASTSSPPVVGPAPATASASSDADRPVTTAAPTAAPSGSAKAKPVAHGPAPSSTAAPASSPAAATTTTTKGISEKLPY